MDSEADAVDALAMTDQPPLLSFSILRDDVSFAMLEAEWEDLFRRAAMRSPFLRYSWVRLCWNRRRTDRSARLFVVVVRDGERVVLIAPFLESRSLLFFRALSFLDSLTPQYNDVLVEDSERAVEYVAYLWATLIKTPRLRRLRLKWIREDSRLSPHLDSARLSGRRTDRAPYIDLAQFGEWESFFGSLSKSLRTDHRRQLRRLERLGSVECRLASHSSLSGEIAWLFSAKRDWLERTQSPWTWLAASETEQLFTAAAVEGLASGRTWLHTLCVDSRTIAANLSFREGLTLNVSKLAYDPAWQTYSPGRTLLLLTIQRAFKERLEICDLMIGEGWKQSITKRAVRVTGPTVILRYP